MSFYVLRFQDIDKTQTIVHEKLMHASRLGRFRWGGVLRSSAPVKSECTPFEKPSHNPEVKAPMQPTNSPSPSLAAVGKLAAQGAHDALAQGPERLVGGDIGPGCAAFKTSGVGEME